MAKRLTALARRTIGRTHRDLDAWHLAHDVRNEMAGALLRLQLFGRCHGSASARQASVLIQAVLTKLDDLEDEGPSSSDVTTVSRPRPTHRIGHA